MNSNSRARRVPRLRPLALALACSVCACPSVRAVEPWADEHLAVTNGMELWFDASRQNAARSARQLPPLAAGAAVDYLLDGSGQTRHLAQTRPDARPRYRQGLAGSFLAWDGRDDALEATLLRAALSNATVFLVAAPRTNSGEFRGFFGFSQAGRNDYTTGLNFDFGPWPTPWLSFLNAEGGGFGGAVSLWGSAAPEPFRRWHTFALAVGTGANGVRAFLDGRTLGSRDRQPAPLRLDSFVLGARHYSNSGEPPFTQGFFQGDLAEFLLYERALSDPERDLVEKYLAKKYATLLAQPPGGPDAGEKPLVLVSNPPPVQMLLPGFATRELPLDLPNVNNLRYRPDGKLVASCYNGEVWLLSDSDGDGLEDKAEPFWTNRTVLAPIGLALTPPGYAHGQGVFLPGKSKLALIVDTNGDDRADQEIEVARWKEKSEQQGVDALGVAVDRAGNVFFSLGAASFTGAYLVDQTTGESGYRLTSERGTILKVSPDFQKREIYATGIRFAVGMAFNARGDLFVTDQEGATWLPNGNPLDELLHIEQGRHYGFPPSHPRYLPDVIDEPSVFDYGPQHQSTCGLTFNEGKTTFGPAHWAGDAIVCGYSRGKIWRTKLVLSAAGYVAQSQLIACLPSLCVDACVSPRGDLLVATHSGKPDWGTGPNGRGKLYRVRYDDAYAPQPVLAWSASPTEIKVAYDRPLDPAALRDVAKRASITQGPYVSPGDRFESIWPGYQVVHMQRAAPRVDVPVLSTSISPDRRTLTLVTKPRTAPVNYAVTLPNFPVAADARRLTSSRQATGPRPPFAETELLVTLHGLEAEWHSDDGKATWKGWLPHADLDVSRAFTQGSAEHTQAWQTLDKPGRLALQSQLDLGQMLQPAVQPGAKLDYEKPAEQVTVASRNEMLLVTHQSRQTFPDGVLSPFDLPAITGTGHAGLTTFWFTEVDSRLRPFSLRRFFVPSASINAASPTDAPLERSIPEIAGGHWLRGKRLFFGDALGCAKCHSIRGEGAPLGPDLSNLVHRDYASVLKDLREPSAAINPDHVAYTAELRDGDSVTGVVLADAADQYTMADATARTLTLPKSRVTSLKPATLSLMPEGLLQNLSVEQLRDLMTFLLTSPLEPASVATTLGGDKMPPARKPAEYRDLLTDYVSRITNPPPIRIVLCASPKDPGHGGAGYHDYPLWRERWSKLLGLADNVEVETADRWPSNTQWKRANVIAFCHDNPAWAADKAKDIDAFLERGGGLIFLHWSVNAYRDVQSLAPRLGRAWGPGAKFRHGAEELALTPHELTAGLGPLRLVDETYWNLTGDLRDATVLATCVEDGAPQPQVWIRTPGKGRVFVCIPGHFTWTYDDPLFRVLLLRAFAWAGEQPLDRFLELATVGARVAE